tara:strand:+ start:1596 stop:1778 length:183 start_codon:yes stop_codon:yes gene_type:complete
MDQTKLTDNQFNQFLEILIQYKKTCPDKIVTISNQSFKEATEYFVKTGLFEEDYEEEESE